MHSPYCIVDMGNWAIQELWGALNCIRCNWAWWKRLEIHVLSRWDDFCSSKGIGGRRSQEGDIYRRIGINREGRPQGQYKLKAVRSQGRK